MDFDRIIILANIFIKRASDPTTSAQSSDVEDVLAKAGLWNVSDQVAPLLDAAKVPEECKVKIGLSVDKTYNISFIALLDPQNAAAKMLSISLKKKFGDAMKKALLNAKLNITDTLTLKWLSF
jgi:hypothetical protein